jgi:carbamoyl-phosphate synthase large subunit
MKKIMITSVGSIVGQNVLDALNHRREQLVVIGTNSIPYAADNFRCDVTYLVSPADETDVFIEQLYKIIAKESPDLVIPGRDDDIAILAHMREASPDLADIFLCGSSHFAKIMDDKVKSSEFCEQHDLPFAFTIESGTENILENTGKLTEKYGFPFIAKPCKGNGSRGIWVVTNQSQLENVCKVPGYAIQPLIGHSDNIEMDLSMGIPFVWEVEEKSLYAVQVLIDKLGNIISSFGFVVEMVMGKCVRMERCNDRLLDRIAHRFASNAVEAGWRGPLNIQVLLGI